MGNLADKPPMLLVMNKKDLIKPGEIAKKLEVRACILIYNCLVFFMFTYVPFLIFVFDKLLPDV